MSGGARATRARLGRIDRGLDALITPERILASAGWLAVERTIFAALAPHPEAREAVRAGLEAHRRRLDGGA